MSGLPYNLVKMLPLSRSCLPGKRGTNCQITNFVGVNINTKTRAARTAAWKAFLLRLPPLADGEIALEPRGKLNPYHPVALGC